MTALIVLSLIAVLELVFGIFVVSRKNRTIVHKAFFTFCFVTGLWTLTFGIYTSQYIISDPANRFLVKTIYLLGWAISSCYLTFTWVFPEGKSKYLNRWHLFWLSAQFLIILILLSGNVLIIDVHPGKNLAESIDFNPLGNTLYTLFFASNMLGGGCLFIRKYLRAKGLEKAQISYVGGSFFTTLVLGASSAIFLPYLGVKSFIQYSPPCALIYISITTYAIARYQLMDIAVVIKRTTLYLVLVGFITAAYTFILILPQNYFGERGSFQSIGLTLIAALIIAITLQPLRDWLDKVTDKVFYQKKYIYYKLLERLSRGISTVIKMEDMLNMVASTRVEAMHRDKVGR